MGSHNPVHRLMHSDMCQVESARFGPSSRFPSQSLQKSDRGARSGAKPTRSRVLSD